MTLDDLYTRVVETTGLDVVTVESLSTAVSNCFADLTSRGYRNFKELVYEQNTITSSIGMAEIGTPSKLRKTLYFRVQFEKGIAVASRLSISNPRIQSKITEHGFRTDLYPSEVVYYIKGNSINVEWDERKYGKIVRIFYGYYERLSAPRVAVDESELSTILLNIREEFEDAVVLYCVYFFYQRTLKEDNRVQAALNNYKYLVEDLLHELAYEDTYNDDEVIITGEE